nr:loganic acid O-methyltransferase-like [Ziziphus jujuba var. spinosa]
MVLILPGIPNGIPHFQCLENMNFDILGSCLVDMAKKRELYNKTTLREETAKESRELSEAYPMAGGDGLHSYANNSSLQREALDLAKVIMMKEIAEKLETETVVCSNTFCIADLGCSVGPNTFAAVEKIIEGVKLKYESLGLVSEIPEFQVFFNDHVTNDFNLLFTSLPQDKPYYAAGVPGSFYGRLFPEASIHFFHSSTSLQWLSRVPKEVVNKTSPAWNKGRIHYSNSRVEVIQAYKAQFDEDMERFLQARALEIVYGGLMVLIIPGIPNGASHSQSLENMIYDLLGSCLMDMAQKEIIQEEKVDSINIPAYFTTPQELEAAVERNGCFNIERTEILREAWGTLPNAHQAASHIRACMGGVIKQHFKDDIIDKLFDLYHKKLEETLPFVFESGKRMDLFVLLKRKPIISPFFPLKY